MLSGSDLLRLKVLLIVAVIFTALSVVYVTVQIRGYDRDIQWAIDREEQSLDSIVTLLEEYHLNTFVQRFSSITQNEAVSSALASRERETLYQLVKSEYLSFDRLQNSKLNLHFHLPDGTSFLRMHLPQKYGDKLDEVRPIIKHVHKTKQATSAYEVGRSGCFYRVVEPLYFDLQYVGAVEIGIPVCTFARTIKDLLKVDTSLFFKSDRWAKVQKKQKGGQVVGDFTVIYPDNRNYNLPLPHEQLIHDHHHTIEYNNKVNIVHSLPIFRDYEGKIIGGIITYQDITPFVERKREFVRTAITLMLVLFLAFMLVLYVTLGQLMDRIRAHQKKKAELLSSLEQEIAERKLSEKERQSLQAQLLQSQKMEALGLLSGGVAHDFNNLLTAIMGHTQLILKSEGIDEAVKQRLLTISSAGDKAAGLIRQLMAFSRSQAIEIKPVNLAQVVQDLSRMFVRLLGENIELVLDLDEEQSMVKGDQTQFEQILMNLVINARDAMPQGGLLTITVKRYEVDEEIHCTFSDVEPGTYVMLTVSDTGYGIDPHLIERIFEPFFTTKDEGKGTGLGLSTVFGIIAQHNGNVCVDSEIGRGTTFKIAFPVLLRRKTDEVKAEFKGKLVRGTETILVVEDELPIQEVIDDMLGSLGYTVLIARDAAEAKAVFENNAEDVDVVLVDLVLPDMNGYELSLLLKEWKDNLKVVYMSGYSDEIFESYGLDVTQVKFLRKPLGINKVAETIRAAIDQK